MSNRINILKLEPAAYKAMYGLEQYLETTSLTKTHKELIKTRVGLSKYGLKVRFINKKPY